jgi:hypothetical protein
MIRAVGSSDVELCPACVLHQGLCERHKSHVLPQLAKNIGWLKLMGEALIEQKRRQSARALAVSPEAQAHAARKQASTRARKAGRGHLAIACAVAS